MEQNFDSIPLETRQWLTVRARQQTVERYKLSPALFDEAESLVTSGQVHLITPGDGLVRERGTWAIVTLRECGHCAYSLTGGICVHRLAIAFADLLARHVPACGERSVADNGGGRGEGGFEAGAGVTGLGRGRGYSGPALRRSRRVRKAGTNDHCPKCGGFLDSAGGCNKCGGA